MPSELQLRLLSRLALFRGIPTRRLGELLATLPWRQIRHPKGAILAFRGDPYHELLVLLEGNLAATIEHEDGRTMIVETLVAPGLVAAAILFAGAAKLPVTLTATTGPVTVLHFSRAMLLGLFAAEPRVLENFLADTAGRIVFLSEKLRLMRFATLSQRLAGYLLDQGKQTDSFRLPMTKERLAELFGVTRPALSRCFACFVRAGLIGSSGRQVTIRDRTALHRSLAESG